VPATVDLKDTEVKKYFLFPRGLPGLEGEKRYCVEAIPGNPFFVMLQPAESGPGLIWWTPSPSSPGTALSWRKETGGSCRWRRKRTWWSIPR